MKKLKKKKNKFRLLIKFLLCITYIFIMMILVFVSFKLFKEEKKIVNWKDVEQTDQYSYIEISEMSEAFAEIGNKQFHFVIEKEQSGVWHTYLIAIKKSDYDKYKNLIDATYERIENTNEVIKVYGYPIKINNNVKDLAIKNIKNFVPIENQVVLTEDNFEQYLTNTYLDTTIKKTRKLNYFILVLLLMALVLFILLIFTIFDKVKTVDEAYNMIEKDTKYKGKKKKAKKKLKKKEDKDDIEII